MKIVILLLPSMHLYDHNFLGPHDTPLCLDFVLAIPDFNYNWSHLLID